MAQEFWRALIASMSSWHQSKLFVEHALTVGHDGLHILVGLIIWVIIGLVTRSSLAGWRAWLGVLAIILWNEAVDLWVERWPDPGQQYGEGLKDLLLTLSAPTIVMAAARLRPGLFKPSNGADRS
jgi:hypothetical protein